jgi:hypothetical protein
VVETVEQRRWHLHESELQEDCHLQGKMGKTWELKKQIN